MGCDIHLYQEKRIDGRWVTADRWQPSEYEEDEGKLVIPYDQHLYWQRNYEVFAVLANVRNGYGFAGIVTGTPIKPISEPRGVPSDACREYKTEVDGWGADGHSHSWLTLADIEGYDWTQPKQHRGVLTIEEYRRWKASGEPEPREWAGDVSGPGIEVVDELMAQRLPSTVGSAYGKAQRFFVAAWWTASLRDDCSKFLDAVVPRLRELEAECGVGNARIVFFFDN